MEKIDLIERQNPRLLKFESPDTDIMYPLRIDDRTVFYFRTKERRQAFVAKRYNKKMKKFII